MWPQPVNWSQAHQISYCVARATGENLTAMPTIYGMNVD